MSIDSDIVRLAYKKGYRVTDDGVVMGSSGKPVKTRRDTSCYPIVSVRADGYKGRKRYGRWIRVGRLAAYQKFGEAVFEPGIETRHLDNNKENHRPDNIAIGTHSDNEMDRPPEERSARARNAVRHYLDSIARGERSHVQGGSEKGRVSKKYLNKKTSAVLQRRFSRGAKFSPKAKEV